MGHRKNRKRDRRAVTSYKAFSEDRASDIELDWLVAARAEQNSIADMAREFQGRTTPAKSCGACREFVEDQEGGRGTCLHPGSGVLSPWTDTAACDFYAAQRGVRLGR